MRKEAVFLGLMLAVAIEGRAAILLYAGCPPGYTCTLPPGNSNSGFTSTTTITASTTTQTNNVTDRVDLFSMELRAFLPGGALLLDQTFAQPFSGAAVQSALSAEEAALLVAGAAGFTGPTLTGSNTSLTGTNTTTSSTTTSSIIQPTLTTVGPALLQVGDIGACQGFDTTSGMPFGCSPTTGSQFVVMTGSINIDVDVHTFYTVTVTNTTTNTYTTTQVYDIRGVTASAVPEPGTLGIAAAALMGLWVRRRRTSLRI